MQRLWILVGVFAFIQLSKWAYILFVAPHFGYMGFTYEPPPEWLEAVAIGAGLLPALWMPLAITRPTQVAYWFLYLSVYLPSLLFPCYAFTFETSQALGLMVTLLVSFGLVGLSHLLPLVPLPRVGVSEQTVLILVVGAFVAFNLMMVSVFGIKTQLPGLADVYETRGAFKEGLMESDSSRPVAYAMSWLSHVLNPLLIAWGLSSRRKFLLALGLIGQVYLYSLTGMKGVIFSGALMAAMWFALEGGGRRFGSWIVLGTLAVVGGCVAYDWLADGYTATSLFFRRMVVIPGILTGAYFDYFSDNPKALLAHSIFSPFLESPYAQTPPYIIGELYFRSDGMNANANIWADAYANFGSMGMLAFSLVVAGLFWLIDSAARGLSIRFAGMFIGFGCLAFTNSALIPSLLTHGVWLVFVLTWMLPRPDEAVEPETEATVRPDVLIPITLTGPAEKGA